MQEPDGWGHTWTEVEECVVATNASAGMEHDPNQLDIGYDPSFSWPCTAIQMVKCSYMDKISRCSAGEHFGVKGRISDLKCIHAST